MPRSRLVALIEAAVMIALSATLSEVTLFKMPQGGSVTAGSMVPILLVGLRHGPQWGFIAGLAAGGVNYLIDPYFVHPAQVILDYPLAFALLGLSGLAAGLSDRKAAWAGSLALSGRFLVHVGSGAIFFAEYAPAGQSPWVYSAIYNATYMVPELIISGLLLTVLLPALRRALPHTAKAA